MNTLERNKTPLWLIGVAVLLSLFYIWLEVAHAVSRDWDQETFLYAYNNAFLRLFSDSHSFPQWNPYMQFGVNLNANMPFQLSLSRFFTLVTGSGVWGYFLSRTLLLIIASLCLLTLLKEFKISKLTSLLVLFLFFEYHLALYSHEALPINVAAVLIVASFAYVRRKKFYILGLAALYLGVALNDWVAQATLAIFPLQLLLVYFLRRHIAWKTHLYAVLVLWSFGLFLALPTLLPMAADSKESQKVLTYSQSRHFENILLSIFYYIKNGYLMRLSTALVVVLSFAFALPLVYWRTLEEFTKGFVKAAWLFFLLLAAFYFFKPLLGAIPLAGKIFEAFNPMRPSIITHLLLVVLFGITADHFIFRKDAASPLGWRGAVFVATFLILFLGFNFDYLHHLNRKLFLDKSNMLVLGTLLPILTVLRTRNPKLRAASLAFISLACASLWVFAGTRYYTRKLPKTLNPFGTLGLDKTSLFIGESPASSERMTAFLQKEAKKDFSQTADLRDFAIGHEIGENMFQRYSSLQISTIHGWSNFRPLRAHWMYVWLAEDLRSRDPERFDFLLHEGGFSYPFGARYKKELLNLAGVRFLIADKTEADPRFASVMEGERYRIYENREAFPRAFLARRAQVFDSVDGIGDYFRGTSSQLLREQVVFLKKDIEKLEGGSAFLNSLAGGDEEKLGAGAARIVTFSPNEVVVTTASNTPSILVLTQSFHPGWKAAVDGQPQEILPADYAFLGATLPKGNHTIRFTFSDPNFVKGIYISGAVLTLLLALIFFSWVRFPVLRTVVMKPQDVS